MPADVVLITFTQPVDLRGGGRNRFTSQYSLSENGTMVHLDFERKCPRAFRRIDQTSPYECTIFEG